MLAYLDRLHDAAMVDALQHLVLAAGRPVHLLLLLGRGRLTGQVDPHPAALLHEAVVTLGQPVLPTGTGVQRRRCSSFTEGDNVVAAGDQCPVAPDVQR
ncbi:hypothetical protein ACPCTK_11980 [Streptomyces pseudogriseolus]|uniref:hypothetical protein n=1 Tax=Streptomyces pseudogriseolus TaxID=36817 RepID=UPI003FA29754